MRKSKYERFYQEALKRGYLSGYIKRKGIELTLFVYPIHDESVSYKLVYYDENQLIQKIRNLPKV